MISHDVIHEGVAALWQPGTVTEVRALKTARGTASGYFDDPDALMTSVRQLDEQHVPAVYATLNPVVPSLLARSANRVTAYARDTTQDAHIVRRSRLLIDLDARRPSGISASDVEHEAAVTRAVVIREYLREREWPEPLYVDSGNGAHLIYAIDLPNDAEATQLVRDVLSVLAERFGDDVVEVDQSVHNAARIAKIPGTWARKGDNLPDRPHRQSRVIDRPDVFGTAVVAEEQLAALVGEFKSSPAPQSVATALSGAFDLEAFLVQHMRVKRGPEPHDGALRWIVDCPFDSSHKGTSAAVLRLDAGRGAIVFKCQHNGCRDRRWEDVRAHYQPVRTSSASGASLISRASGVEITAEERWPSRVALEQQTAPAALPVELVPEPLRANVDDIAARMSVPIGFVAMPMIVALGSVIGTSIAVKPKKYDNAWYEFPNLWGALVAEPGMLKSPVLSDALQPLYGLAKTARDAYAEKRMLFDERVALSQRSVDQLELEMKKRFQKGADIAGLEEQLAALRAERGEPPIEPAYIVHDSTIEALSVVLRDNPRGVMQVRDELVGFLRSMEKQGREGDRAFYLECWSGKNPYSTHRIGRGNVHIDRLCLSVQGTIQPGPLRELVAEAELGGGGADGLIQRFQLLSVLSVISPWKNVDRAPDVEARNRTERVFRFVDRLEASLLATNSGPVPLICFSTSAQTVFDDWRADLEQRIRDDNLPPTFRAFIAKMRKTVPALALIFHLCGAVETGEKSPISVETIEDACAWGEVIESHARWLYEPRRVQDATGLARHIKSGKIEDGATVRSIQNRGLAGLTTRDSLGAALSVLETAHWIRLERTQPGKQGGAPSEIVRMHPELREIAT